MANFTSEPPSVKKLKEVLQEQQEPFILDVYLSERQYRKKRSSRYQLKSKSSSIQLASRILSLASKKLLPANNSQDPSNCSGVACKVHDSGFVGKTINGFSAANSVSSERIFRESFSWDEENSGSSSSASISRASKLISLKKHEAASDTKFQQECMKENKKFRTVSVPKYKPFKEDSLLLSRSLITRSEEIASVSSCISPKHDIGDAVFSACLSGLIKNTLIHEKQNHVGFKELNEFIMYTNYSTHIKIVRVLQQTKQLLFDCIKEATEIHERKGKRRKSSPPEFLGPEELGKIICEHICLWAKQSGDVTNIIQLIGSDLYGITEEWSNLQLISRRIGIEIGNNIMDEIIMEMVDIYLQ